MSAWTWLTAQGVSQREPVKKATKSPLFKAHVTVTAKDPKESDEEGSRAKVADKVRELVFSAQRAWLAGTLPCSAAWPECMWSPAVQLPKTPSKKRERRGRVHWMD